MYVFFGGTKTPSNIMQPGKYSTCQKKITRICWAILAEFSLFGYWVYFRQVFQFLSNFSVLHQNSL